MRSFQPSRAKKYIRFFEIDAYAASFNQHNIIDRSHPGGLASPRGFGPREGSQLALPRMPSFTVPTAEDTSTCTIAKTYTWSRNRSLKIDFFLPNSPTFDSISTLTSGQEDQTLRQEVKGIWTHCWVPLSKHSTRPASDQRTYSFPAPLSPCQPPPFSSPPSILSLSAGKAGNPKKWTADFRHRGTALTRRNSFVRTSA